MILFHDLRYAIRMLRKDAAFTLVAAFPARQTGGLQFAAEELFRVRFQRFCVRRRTSELAIRVALGAQRADVIRMVFRESLIPVIGVILGLAAALVFSRWVESMLP